MSRFVHVNELPPVRAARREPASKLLEVFPKSHFTVNQNFPTPCTVAYEARLVGVRVELWGYSGGQDGYMGWEWCWARSMGASADEALRNLLTQISDADLRYGGFMGIGTTWFTAHGIVWANDLKLSTHDDT